MNKEERKEGNLKETVFAGAGYQVLFYQNFLLLSVKNTKNNIGI